MTAVEAYHLNTKLLFLLHYANEKCIGLSMIPSDCRCCAATDGIDLKISRAPMFETQCTKLGTHLSEIYTVTKSMQRSEGGYFGGMSILARYSYEYYR